MIKNTQYPVLLGIGANLSSSVGPPVVTIAESIAVLASLGLGELTVSRLFQTPAFPPGSGPDFTNGVILCKTDHSAHEILTIINSVEEQFGRKREHRWDARTMDIDLLAVGDQILPDRATHAEWRKLDLADQISYAPDQLILPHPRLQDRSFVLVPLADVAPDWVHPILGKTAAQMLVDLPESHLGGIHPT